MDKDEFFKKVDEIQQETVSIRGNIINATIQIEMLIDSIIINYFIKSNMHSEFMTKFLNNKFCSSFLKIDALKKINLLDESEIKGSLERIFEIRNIVAHYPPIISLNTPIVLNGPKNETVNLTEINKEFIEKYQKVKLVLTKIVFDLINKNQKNNS